MVLHAFFAMVFRFNCGRSLHSGKQIVKQSTMQADIRVERFSIGSGFIFHLSIAYIRLAAIEDAGQQHASQKKLWHGRNTSLFPEM